MPFLAKKGVKPAWVDAVGDPSTPGWLFSDGVGNHKTPLVSRSPRMLLPKVLSFDDRVLKFIRAWADSSSSELPASVDAAGFVGANGIHRDFSQLKTVAGYSMTPMSYTPVDNAAYAAELGLPADFHSTRHREIFDALWDRIFGSWTPRSIKVPDLSTMGPPVWSNEAHVKRSYGSWLFDHSEEVLSTFASGDLYALARDYGVVHMYNIGRRDQVDTVGKVRLVFPLDYALSAGKKGAPIAADKRVVMDDGRVYEDFSAGRARVYHGGAFSMNLFLQAVATGTQYAMFENYPYTFHHTDIDAKAKTISATETVSCMDISDYDRSMREFLLRRAFDRARRVWDTRIVDWAEHAEFAAYFSRPLSMEGRPVMVGDWLSMKPQVIAGNRSGHAWTSLIAKGMKVFDDLCVLDDLHHDILERMDSYLRGEMPMKIWNNGDDAVIIGPKALIKRFNDHRFNKKHNPGYFVAEPEVGQVFSGKLLQPNGDGFTAIPRLHTMAEKIYVPERSIGGNFRKYWTVGIMARFNPEQQGQGPLNPSHGTFVELHQRAWRDHMSQHFGDFMQIILREHQFVDMNMDGLTAIDLEVLEDPDKLYYKYRDSDVSPHVLNALFGSAISPDEYVGFTDYYSGTII